MTDLTKIEKPFGLLDDETQRALMEHPGPFEVYGADWSDVTRPAWFNHRAYRVKPKPREWWFVPNNGSGGGGSCIALGGTLLSGKPFGNSIHLREVIE